jgi:biopolymer transport protein ExbB
LNKWNRLLRIAALLLLGLAWGPAAWAWWNGDWNFRKEIDFDLTPTGADIPGAPTDVPVLIRLSLGNFQYFGDAKPDGSDFRFVAADDKTPLAFHIEHFDPQTQIALAWVRVPRLTGGAKTDKIFLYYGNKTAVSAADPAGTYDTSQALVYHFGAPKSTPQDSTGYKTEPTAFNADADPTSLIGSGVKFSGSQVITIPATGAVHLQPGKGLTISTWVRFDAAQPPTQAYVAELADQGKELVLGIAGTRAFARYNGGAGPITVTQTDDLTTGQWHHLAVRIGDGRLTLFVDGADAAHANVDVQELGGSLTIGGSAANGNYYNGQLDELEVASSVRSADWLKAAARSQGMVAPLVVYGGDTQKEGGHESYFTTTLRNVTADGWVVIGILTVMFLASMLIMITKALYLNRVAQGNTRFLESFYEESGEDPAALARQLAKAGSGRSFGLSTLAQLYDQGMAETFKRLEGQAAGADRARVLSAQSIEAIRATMDAGLTRRLQQLNRSMVWLTVSIAGGPFLGLLGTVVGVMITFAAIAASGDVNINAIAPGIAAALVATVAGLGVAIPCLFGYNYLASRIKEIAADTRVFVDEFVTRIAETYS